jgi:tetratricopeptide (TPR) repeat protein
MHRPPDRRAVLLALLGVAAAALRPVRGLAQAPATDLRTLAGAGRETLLAEGEAALAGGNTDAALRLFERAASMRHAADSELALVRTYMQLGQYRRAVAFAAHTAGAHRNEPGAIAFYAWLLYLGGQVPAAERALADAGTATPSDAVASVVRAALRAGSAATAPSAAQVPARLAPYGPIADLPPSARVACSGTLVAGGRAAIVSLADVRGAARVWVRNGLGQASAARVERRFPSIGVATVALARPLPGWDGLAVAARDPFPGSIGYAASYAAVGNAASWPLLRGGFVGRAEGDAGIRRLGVELPPIGGRGGPVFGADGALAGIAVRGPDGIDRLLLPSRLDAIGVELGPRLAPAVGDATPVPRPSTDEIYESAMRVAVQVLSI